MDLNVYFDCNKIRGLYEKAVAEETAKVLMYCCEKEPEFKQAVEQSGKTFQECLADVCKGIGQSFSDFKLYNKAAQFYFPPAKIGFTMHIDLSGNNGHKAPPITKTDGKPIEDKPKEKSELTISLDDLLGDL